MFIHFKHVACCLFMHLSMSCRRGKGGGGQGMGWAFDCLCWPWGRAFVPGEGILESFFARLGDF